VSDLDALTPQAREQMLKAATRLLKVRQAKEHLIPFVEATMPHPSDPDDVSLTRYDARRFHQAIAAAFEEVEAGRIRRLILEVPPRHGKTELISRRGLAWCAGRNPYNSYIFGTYNQEFADDGGRAVRDILAQSAFGQIFPASA
jgi:hypothetical protein